MKHKRTIIDILGTEDFEEFKEEIYTEMKKAKERTKGVRNKRKAKPASQTNVDTGRNTEGSSYNPLKKPTSSESNHGFLCAEMSGFEYLQPRNSI